MNMSVYDPPGSQPEGLIPWYQVPGRKSADMSIVCGHWAALGYHREPGLIALDSGCVWGGRLTAVCLDSEEGNALSVTCPSHMRW
jgi:bis(5'-nucleosyl)-tetraphosphatase (symmetrical)